MRVCAGACCLILHRSHPGLDLTRTVAWGPGAHPLEVVGPGEAVMSQPTGPDRAQSGVCLELVGTRPQNRMYSERKGFKEEQAQVFHPRPGLSLHLTSLWEVFISPVFSFNTSVPCGKKITFLLHLS